MKKSLLLIIGVFCLCFSLHAQVYFDIDMESGWPTGWTESFASTTTNPCEVTSERDNLYSFSSTGHATSPTLSSNGEDMDVSFDYKIVDYSTYAPTSTSDFTSVTFDVSTDGGTTWTAAYTINSTNHVESSTCATVSFTVPAASVPAGDIQVRIYAIWASGDWYLYLDNFSAEQMSSDPPTCDVLLTDTADIPTVNPTLSWSTPSGGVVDLYTINIGSASGMSDVVANATSTTASYTLNATLDASTTYYITIVPSNSNGSANGCTEQTFMTALAPPDNNECSSAAILNLSTDDNCDNAVSGTTVSATPSSEYSCSSSYNSVWYEFAPDVTGIYTFERTLTSGSTSTYVSVWEGTCDSLERLNSSCYSSSAISLSLEGGTTYLVSVSTYNSGAVDFTLCVFQAPEPPSNDDCVNAEVITESTDESCANAVAGTTTSASNSSDYSCTTTHNEVWYEFTPTQSTAYVFERTITSGTGSTYVSVWEGTCGSLQRLNGSCYSSTAYTLDLQADTTYYVSVATYNTGAVDFTLCVYLAPEPPANNTCDAAESLSISTDGDCDNAVSGTTINATNSSDYSCSSSYNEVWYMIEPSQTGDYIFQRTIDAGSGSAYISVWSGSCGSLSQENSSCYTSGPLSVSLTGGETYFVSVATYNTGAVDFTLCVYPAPEPPDNDACADAINLDESTASCENAATGTTISATASSDYASCSSSYNSVWYTFTPENTGDYEFNRDILNGSGSTYVSVWSGTCGNLTKLNSSCYSSSITVALMEDTTYYVSVSTYNTSAGVDFELCAVYADGLYCAILGIADGDTVAMSCGTGMTTLTWAAPDVGLEADSFEVFFAEAGMTLASMGYTQGTTMTIPVTTGTDYSYHVVCYADGVASTACITHTFTAGDETVDEGVGDEGYSYQNIYAGAAPYDWIDPISEGHTEITSWSSGTVDDGYYNVTNMGIDFHYVPGTFYSGCYIGTNGYVSFGTGYTSTGAGVELGSTSDPDNMIAVAMMDLDVGNNGVGDVYYGLTDGKFVVTWMKYHDFLSSTSTGLQEYMTFQLILDGDLDGGFTLQYNQDSSSVTTSAFLSDAVIGAEFGDSEFVSYRQDGVGGPIFCSNMAVRFESPALLPLEYGDFYGEPLAKSNMLYWNTIDESNIEKHLVERMNYATNEWEVIGEVEAIQNEAIEKSYSFEDTRPLFKSTYRIRTIELNGVEYYSKIVDLYRTHQANSIELNPNPSDGNFNFEMYADQDQQVDIKVFDYAGKLVTQRTQVVNQGLHYEVLDLTALSPGIYSTQISTINGTSTQRVVIY